MRSDRIRVPHLVRVVQCLTIAFVILFLFTCVNAQVGSPQLVYSAPDGKIQSFNVGSVAVIDIKADRPFIFYYVVLGSEGGDDNEAKMIADTINGRCAANATCRITTYVKHSCSSACKFMFGKIGNSHIAGPEARFGFHASRNISTAKVDLALGFQSVKFYADVCVRWLALAAPLVMKP